MRRTEKPTNGPLLMLEEAGRLRVSSSSHDSISFNSCPILATSASRAVSANRNPLVLNSGDGSCSAGLPIFQSQFPIFCHHESRWPGTRFCGCRPIFLQSQNEKKKKEKK